MNEEPAICSLVVHCQPDLTNTVVNRLKGLPQTEVNTFDDSGKIIVILESDAEHSTVDLIDTVQFTEGVISTMLVYHQLLD